MHTVIDWNLIKKIIRLGTQKLLLSLVKHVILWFFRIDILGMNLGRFYSEIYVTPIDLQNPLAQRPMIFKH